MKNLIFTLGVVLGACGLSYGVFYAGNREPAAWRRAAREGDALAWLRAEFKVSDSQFTAIKRLHEEYSEVCAGHCAMIIAAEKRGASQGERVALEKQCVDAMTEHFRRVAALMSPGEGERYLATVLPRIADYDHRESPTVQVRH